MSKHFATTAALLMGLASTSAQAGDWTEGWTWLADAEAPWDQPTLLWAQQLHPQHPSLTVLANEFSAPPSEPWCIGAPMPSPLECGIYKESVYDWMYDFLEIPYSQPLPQNRPPMPQACPSACQV